MLKVFVTGSEGFVGQHLISLLKKSYSVIGLSRQTSIPSSENIKYVQGDILDCTKIEDILRNYQPDIIVHLAGIAKTWNNEATELFHVNLNGTLNIYQQVVKIKQEIAYDPKIIFISSAEVYGRTDRLDNITEESPLFPINTYGVSKAAADRLTYQYSQSDQLKTVIIRPFPHIGPGQRRGFFVSDMVSQIVELEQSNSSELFVGNLSAIRDYLDVRDVVRAYTMIMEHDFQPGEVFNLCSGQGIEIKQILHKLLALTDKKIEIKQDPQKLRPVDLPVFIGNNSKIKHALGWKPEYSLDQTLAEVMEYWRQQKGVEIP